MRLRVVVSFLSKAMVLAIAVAMVSGCGTYKQDLENAKQQIEKLSAEIKNLNDLSAGLDKEKGAIEFGAEGFF